MLTYVLRRLAFSLGAVVVASVLIFVLIRAAGGNVAAVLLGKSASAEAIAALAHQYGLDQPLSVQYFDWAARMLQGDLGRSFRTNEGVVDPRRLASVDLGAARVRGAALGRTHCRAGPAPTPPATPVAHRGPYWRC